MRVLLTGATGNVGQGVLRSLVKRGHVVLAVGRNRQRLERLRQVGGDQVELYPCDLSAGDLRLPDDYEAVVHAAAHATAKEDPDAHVVHNVVATRNLLSHAARHPTRPFVFFSSLSVFGTIREAIVDEQTAICDPGSYGASKLMGEMLLKEYGTIFASVALRLPGILGPGAKDPWLARVLQDGRAGWPISLYCPDTPFNNAVHVEDLGTFVCELMSRAKPGFDVLTLGASDAKPLREVVLAMLAHQTAPPVLQAMPAPRRPFIISIHKAIDQYGYRPSGIVETVQRYAQIATANPEAEPALSTRE